MDACLLYIGTEDGLFVYRWHGDQVEPVGRGLQGNAVRGIAVHPHDPQVAYVACGLRGWGLHRTRDAGRSFEALGFGDQWVWDVAFHPADPRTLWIGTEPPMVYVTRDEGRTFELHAEIEKLPDRRNWTFFYPPFHAGHIHGFAMHPARPERIIAGVEQGGLIYSRDGGATWSEALVGGDLHRIAVDPGNPDRVLAGAGEGLFLSEDGGETWAAVRPLMGKYIHAVVFDPAEPSRVYVYADDHRSPLYKSEDGGSTWSAIGSGLPTAQPADNVSLHPRQPGVLFYAGDIRRGVSRLFVSHDAGASWRPLPLELPKVWRLRTAPGT